MAKILVFPLQLVITAVSTDLKKKLKIFPWPSSVSLLHSNDLDVPMVDLFVK